MPLRFLLYPYAEPENPHRGASRFRPSRKKAAPLILSREEVKALLQAPRSLRHRTMLAVLYGSGLRVAEAAQLKVSDIDTPRNAPLGCGLEKEARIGKPCCRRGCWKLLRGYWRAERPGEWLFPGADPNRPISAKAIYLACRNAAQLAGLSKPVHLALPSACLRHPSTRGWHQSPVHSDPAWSCQPGKPQHAIFRLPTLRSAPRLARWIPSAWI